MSWKYQNYRKYEKFNFYYSEKEIDFTSENLDYSQFILQEFFNADSDTQKQIAYYYTEKYGQRSYDYLKNKYSEWACGNYHLTDYMKERILSFMPRFLNSRALHKLGIHEFVSTIKKTIKNHYYNQNAQYKNSRQIRNAENLVALFVKEYESIQSLKLAKSWYKVLNEKEQTLILAICKYILETKLQRIYLEVKRDLNTFSPFLSPLKKGLITATYIIKVFNCRISLIGNGFDNFELPKFKLKRIEYESEYKIYAEKYLAYELATLYQQKQAAITKSFLNTNDLSIFFRHYTDLTLSDSEVVLKSTFQGEGGSLEIVAEFKPLKLIKTTFFRSIALLLIYFIILMGLLVIIIGYKLWFLLFFGGIFLVGIIISLLGKEIRNLKSSIIELKLYGKH